MSLILDRQGFWAVTWLKTFRYDSQRVAKE